MRVISIIVWLVAPGDPALHKSTEDEEHPSLLNKTRCQLCIDAPPPPPPPSPPPPTPFFYTLMEAF